MRRILAIAILMGLWFPMVSPLFVASPNSEASLPACCRSHGAHHCAMMHMAGVASSGPAFQAPTCPLYPTPATPLRVVTASLATALPPSAEIRRDSAPTAVTPHRARTFSPSANLNRGPPAHSA